jgi:hypothetical protein
LPQLSPFSPLLSLPGFRAVVPPPLSLLLYLAVVAVLASRSLCR